MNPRTVHTSCFPNSEEQRKDGAWGGRQEPWEETSGDEENAVGLEQIEWGLE